MLLNPQLVLLRLGLTFVFGAIVGVEREWRHKAAGIKTNTLVALGSATFALLTNTFGPNNHNPAQLAAAVVSGIGFIGAGVIIHRGPSVQGVTTAATLWASAAMGVAVGLGFYAVGSLTFVGIILVQFGMRQAVLAVAKRAPGMHEIEVRVECTPSSLPEVNAAWRDFTTEKKIRAVRRTTKKTSDGLVWRAVFIAAPSRDRDLSTIEERLVKAAGVSNVEARQVSPLDEEG